MATAVEMPKMSDTMEEGVLVAWLAEEGDAVSAGDVVAQVETDKATMDLEVYDDGVLLKRVVEEGESVPIGGLIAVLGKEGEDVSDVLAQYGGGDGAPAAPAGEEETEEKGIEEKQAEESAPKEDAQAPAGDGAPAGVPEGYGHEGQRPEPTPAPPQATGDGEGRVKASPLARRMAAEQGLDLSGISGSGPEGRIVKRDVEAAMGGPSKAKAPEPPPPSRRAAEPVLERPQRAAEPVEAVHAETYDRLAITQMRKTIARRLAESKFTAPHFYLTVDIDMARAVAVREKVNALSEKQGRPKVSMNDVITKACAVALRRHPAVNSSYLEREGEIRRHREVHVAVAVAVDEGLLTPVIRHADRKGLAEIAEETRGLAEKARNRELQPSDWEGSTFTTSNLGMFGIEEFTAIINPPNACILAIGAIRDVPVVEDGEVRPGKRMRVTLSCDHRVVDGATGARFLDDVRRFIEEPVNLLL
jgi:pyruvate dehydrogenase E2 component (dihydrolipoamide acetyltransferase)